MKSPDYIGKWKGTVIVVNVEYEFKRNGEFVVSSYASNNIVIGGRKGTYKVVDDEFILSYKKSYKYDSTLEKGEWSSDSRVLSFEYELISDKLSLVQKSMGFKINLQKS